MRRLALSIQHLKDTHNTGMFNTHRPGLQDIHLAPKRLHLHLHLELEVAWAPPDSQHLSEAVVGAGALWAGVAAVGAGNVAGLRQR